jgi:creatinine amidohydrolase/Fe(II)-dependent formamide hydrolase-like protein
MSLKLTRPEIEACGKFPPERRKVFIFSVGNDFEAHGPALPAEIDSLMARMLANQLALNTGAYYWGHIPFTSDRVGAIARDWSPLHIDFERFTEKTVAFIKAAMAQFPWPAERIVIFVGHGGLVPLLMMGEELSGKFGVKTRVGFVAGVGRVELPKHLEARDTVEKILLGAGEHAYILEHSVAAALGVLDWGKLEQLNREAAQDPEALLKRHPALAGLGGYQLFGDPKRYGGLKEVGLEFVLNDFLKRKKMVVSAELGELLVAAALKTAELLLL